MIDEATKKRHAVDQEGDDEDYVELTKEMKSEIESHDWISSKNFVFDQFYRVQWESSIFTEKESQAEKAEKNAKTLWKVRDLKGKIW